jgi:hypothetical protein
MTREGYWTVARYALGWLLVTIAGRAQPAEAAVVVFDNRSEATVKFGLRPVWGQSREYSLDPGRVLPVNVPDTVELTYTREAEEVSQPIDPNTVHNFVVQGEKLVVEPVRFSQSSGTGWLYVEGRRGPPPAVVVPVKILADEEHGQAQGDWQSRLRSRLDAASKAIEPYCGVRFQVAGAGTWKSDDEESDFRRLEAQFRREVAVHPAWLAIGVTGQFQISEEHPLGHSDRRPLFAHLLLPRVQGGLSQADQSALLVHELGHFLGAVHSPEETSVMRSPVPQEKEKEKEKVQRLPSGADFDAVNTLVMNLIAEEIRLRRARHLGQIERNTRRYLGAIYWEMARKVRNDRQAYHAAESLREPVLSGPRYTGEWTDGSRRSGEEVGPWHQPESSPRLGGRPLFSGAPIRWLVDHSVPSADPPRAMVELVGGDCLPGRVVGGRTGDESLAQRLAPHLLVVPYARLDWPSGPSRPQIRVRIDSVRRIVWKPLTDRYQPGTLVFRDGRRMDFRSVRLTERSIRLLREEGIREVALSDTAEIHFPEVDPWQAYFAQLAELCPDGTARIGTWETGDGLRATASWDRFQPSSYGSHEDPGSWYQVIQPAWSLDPFWLRHRGIRLRCYFMPHEVPLSRIDPIAVRQRSDLGGAWQWRVDRNVQGGPLVSGGAPYGWGFGVHAGNELEFLLPGCARSFRARLGLDELAGDGGCVEAKVFVGSTRAKPLFASPVVVGSGKVHNTGRLSVQTSSGGPGRLILEVDAAHDRRPEGADPFDLRDTFDWLEPIVELDARQLREEVARHAPERIPAWRGWEVATGEAKTARLVNAWDQADPREPGYRLTAASGEPPLRISRQLEVRPERDRLVLTVSRPPESPASKLEVQVDQEPVAEFEVPARHSAEAPAPLVVSLSDYCGPPITVEVIQRGQGEDALVEWRGIAVAGPAAE